jgi:hypothetical protein
MAVLDNRQITVWDDNYVYLAHDPGTDDAGVAAAVGMSGGDPFAEARGRKDRF